MNYLCININYMCLIDDYYILLQLNCKEYQTFNNNNNNNNNNTMEAYTNNTITSLLPSLILLTSTTTTTNLLNDNNYNNSSTNNNDTNGVLQSDERTFRSLQVTGFFTFFIGFPTNLIIISLVLCKRRLRNPTNFFVCSLAVADIMVLLWLLIWVLGIQNILSTIQVKRFITPSIDIFLGVASMVNVACVSADRGIAVVYPLRYEFIVSKRRAVCAIIIAWTYAVSLLIAAFLRIQYHNAKYYKVILYAGFTSYFVPVSIILVSYSVIFVVIVRKLKSIRELERVVSSVAGGANCGVNQGCDDLATRIRKKRRRRKLLRELKVTANILFIVVPFTSGWSYFIGTHIYEHAYKVRFDWPIFPVMSFTSSSKEKYLLYPIHEQNIFLGATTYF